MASTYESSTIATAYNLTFIKTEVNPSYNMFGRFYGRPPPLPEYCIRDVRRERDDQNSVSTLLKYAIME